MNQQPSGSLIDCDASEAWKAELRLGFSNVGDKTVLTQRSHYGPLLVQRPFYPEGDVCHVYLLHPPGGVVAGDKLKISLEAEQEAKALITTPAAGKFYRSTGKLAEQTIEINIADHATLEWLPQETIIYEGARLRANGIINLSVHAGFIGWEILVLGRPAAGEGFEKGELILHWRISCNGQLLYLDRICLDTAAFKARWGMNSNSSYGSLFAYPATPALLLRVQDYFAEKPGLGVTLVGELLICRGIDKHADSLRAFFESVWKILRPDIIGRNSCPPRIWAT
jgi:urease accessory protein